MKRVLLMTVGTGTRPDVDIAKPLVKSIKNSRPDLTCLIVTEASEKHGRRICQEMGWPDDDVRWMMRKLPDPDNFEKVFLFVNETIQEIAARGYCTDDIEVDFTSGTKAMSAGALLASVLNRCGTAKYITGERRAGTVIDGTEEFRAISPSRVFALHDIRLVEEMIKNLRFAAAGSILAGLDREGLGPDNASRIRELQSAVQGFSAWEIFDHRTAYNKLRTLTASETRDFPIAPSPEAVEMLERLGKGIKRPDADILADLYNNASRRGHEGKYDDAVARLYRLTELFAQQVLHREFRLDTGDMELSLVPATLRDRFEKLRDSREGKIKIGLHAAYETLAKLGHRTGCLYMEDSTLQGLLRERNRSILAHGLHPVPKSVYEGLRARVSRLVSSEVQDFEGICSIVQFPWLSGVL